MKKYGVIFLSMGGPTSMNNVDEYLSNILNDKDIMRLPFKKVLIPIILKKLSAKSKKQYVQIGGKDPINELTFDQASKTEQELKNAFYDLKCYVSFRYCSPRIIDVLKNMKEDGITDAIAFSQYPQYSYTTSGSSLNELAGVLLESEFSFNWSVIDTWCNNEFYIHAWVDIIQKHLNKFNEKERSDVLVVFSAHSVPMKTICNGDPYVYEIGSTVHDIIKKLQYTTKCVITWQSVHGPSKWLEPKTEHYVKEILKGSTHKHILIVPIAFTTDHVETLCELDIEMLNEINGTLQEPRLHRVDSLNSHPLFINALANIVQLHIRDRNSPSLLNQAHTYKHECVYCESNRCKNRCDLFHEEAKKFINF
ncbi:hypothetical protein A3Q56_03922 [Intoshia linei]|uniref:Ferrochelatase n=1 Tax=Intoshia linei TaxID=1819745 RepID=A0A177B276_9BILA|nr:hypothetical protein A3Q56_03922 [Intoshia linei]